jgi:NAD(P)-dependent dehydrogenase (short-subunit alcohol dehydrogenase family)
MFTQLQGKHVVITGGFGVLGRAAGTVLASRGARVALLDRAPVPADFAPGEGVLAFGGIDLAGGAAAEAFGRIAAELGGVDCLVNVAGGFSWETIEEGAIDTWDRMYSMNLRTAVASAQAALPHLAKRGGGRIVNVGALASLKAGAGMGAYAASKAGVARFTEALAEEVKERGITVNAVMPSIIDTPANRADMPDADPSRWVSPQALAAVIAFLLSDDAAAITGACLPVAGRV